MKNQSLCPRCGWPLQVQRPALNAMSRVDNQTRICGPCGTAEAMWQYEHQGAALPPLDRPVT